VLDVKLAPWSDEDENGQKTRAICYTLSINYGFGQKICPSTEIQVLKRGVGRRKCLTNNIWLIKY